MTPREIQQDILSRGYAYEDSAFLLTTDGSGHDGKYIGVGSAYILRPYAWKNDGWREYYSGACGLTAGSVQRAEMMAMIEGLRAVTTLLGMTSLDAISTMLGREIRDSSEFPPESRVRVRWFTDRQNLAYSVARDRAGIPYYRRRTDEDLWQQFSYYEPFFDLLVEHHDRNTTPDATQCDAVAGRVRHFMLEQFRKINPQ